MVEGVSSIGQEVSRDKGKGCQSEGKGSRAKGEVKHLVCPPRGSTVALIVFIVLVVACLGRGPPIVIVSLGGNRWWW